jgi:hypothetical protein
VAHGRAAHEAIPGSRLEVFPDSGHFPHRDRSRRFVEVLIAFMQSTAPARMDATSGRASLRSGGGSSTAVIPPEPRRCRRRVDDDLAGLRRDAIHDRLDGGSRCEVL